MSNWTGNIYFKFVLLKVLNIIWTLEPDRETIIKNAALKIHKNLHFNLYYEKILSRKGQYNQIQVSVTKNRKNEKFFFFTLLFTVIKFLF